MDLSEGGPQLDQKTSCDPLAETPVRASGSGRAAVVCSTLGCLGWLLVVPFLDACEQGEQLARYFAALSNVILLSVAGGLATLLLLVGLALSRRPARTGFEKLARLARIQAMAGLVFGAGVLLVYLPAALQILF